MTEFDNAGHLHMHQAVKAFKAGDRERLGRLVVQLLASGDLDTQMVALAAGELHDAQYESFRSFLRGVACEGRTYSPSGTYDFGVFAIPYRSESPLGPFLSAPVRDALRAAMSGCGLFDRKGEVFLMDRVLNPVEVAMISESGIFEYGVNTSMMISSGMTEDAELAAVDLVSDIDPFPPMPMKSGVILGVRVLKVKSDSAQTVDRVFFAADYELDDQDFPWNPQWNEAVADIAASHKIEFARPRPWTWAPRPAIEFSQAADEDAVSEESPQMRLVRAAMPFAMAGLSALNTQIDKDGNWFWAGKEQDASIKTWLGPSDFGNLVSALSELGVEFAQGEAG